MGPKKISNDPHREYYIVKRFMWCLEAFNKDELTEIAATASACWKCRNDTIFSGVQGGAEATVVGFKKWVSDFKNQRRQQVGRHPSDLLSASAWSPPQYGSIKLNTDAGMLGEGYVGLGLVARNNRGEAVAMAVRRMACNFKVDLAEASAAKWGLQVMRRLGYQNIVLESDALSLVQSIAKRLEDFSPLGLIIDDILCISNSFLSFSISIFQYLSC